MNALKYVNDTYGAVIALAIATVIMLCFSVFPKYMAWALTGVLLYQWRRYETKKMNRYNV